MHCLGLSSGGFYRSGYLRPSIDDEIVMQVAVISQSLSQTKPRKECLASIVVVHLPEAGVRGRETALAIPDTGPRFTTVPREMTHRASAFVLSLAWHGMAPVPARIPVSTTDMKEDI